MPRSPKDPQFTYADVGATATQHLPSGYRHFERMNAIGTGRDPFLRASELLSAWEMHRRAGIAIPRETPDAAEGVDVRLGLGAGPLKISAPCRVVYVVDAERERGFAYGTLPGHPESGEERFSVLWREDDSVALRIRAFSRPATRLARLVGPAGRAVQDRITTRYLRAIADPG